jgi:hypothetical protein
MTEPFHSLRERLLCAGVAPRHVRRYLGELSEHLNDLRAEEQRAGRSPADAESAALARIGGTDELAKAMIGQRQFRSWCSLAPWAAFGVVPLLVLAGAYLVACLILWSGWRIFLPASETPFVRTGWLAGAYFGVGRTIYFYMPVFIGWGIGLMAARQRSKGAWPVVGMALVALMAGASRVQAFHPAEPGPTGRVSMSLALGSSLPAVSDTLVRSGAILFFAALPWLLWRARSARSAAKA